MNLPSTASEAAAARLDRVRIVLVSTSHPGNVGSAARAMKTMGLTDLVLVTPKDPLAHRDPQAVAMSAGAHDMLDKVRVMASLPEALAGVRLALAFTSRRRELSHGWKPLREAAVAAVDELAHPDARVALVFGSETYGLSNDEVDRCQMVVTIPTNPHYASLNLSQAVQLAAYEVMMASQAFALRAVAPREASSVEEVEKFLEHLERAAIEADFLTPGEPKRFMTRMRRLFSRARMEPEEVAILRGVLAALQKRRA